jgi:hypothetical protein
VIAAAERKETLHTECTIPRLAKALYSKPVEASAKNNTNGRLKGTRYGFQSDESDDRGGRYEVIPCSASDVLLLASCYCQECVRSVVSHVMFSI